MNRLKTLAVGSGKGGVGKTLTSVNLGICAVRNGLKVALVDADPLSNIMVMLDQHLPEVIIKGQYPPVCNAAPGFEVIYPATKQQEDETTEKINLLFSKHFPWLKSRYDLVIVDMPAGTSDENRLTWLEFMDAIVLVTNPEPTAHVSAGAFLKSVMRYWNENPIYLWHNKYKNYPNEKFDPEDVVGNHNNNVPKEQILKNVLLVPIAYVPPDPGLDLIKADPPVLIDLHRSMEDMLTGLLEIALPPLPGSEINDNSRMPVILSWFLRYAKAGKSSGNPLEDLETFLNQAEIINTGNAALPEEVKRILQDWFQVADKDPLRKQLEKARHQVILRIKELEKDDNLFKAGITEAASKINMEKETITLLNTLSKLQAESPINHLACLFFFRYALYKLFSMDTAFKLITATIPRREEMGQSVRDRRQQIAGVLGKAPAWREFFLSVIKKLYPIILKQLETMSESLNLHTLLFRDKHNRIDKKIYLKLFSETMYEMINSGLGVVAGFRFRPSSRAFQEGYETLMAKLNNKEDPHGGFNTST